MPGFVARPAFVLRAEGAAFLALGVLLYWLNGGRWVLFALLLLAPDVSMLGYLAGSKTGAAVYNAFHTYVLPAVQDAYGLLGGSHFAVSVALIWIVHIGMDRMLG